MSVVTHPAASKTHLLYLLLKEQIDRGVLASGTRLQSEPELAIVHKVSRVTVRRALDGLAREGLIRRQPGAGTFVASTVTSRVVTADLANMMASLAEMGRRTQVRLVEFDYRTPPDEVAAALKLTAREKVQRAWRIRSLDGQPFSSLVTYVPERIGRTYTQEEMSSGPLLQLIERSGTSVDRATQSLSATLAGPEAARELGVEIGAALIQLTRVVLDRQGRGIEYLSALYRPDMHSFEMTLSRTGRGAERRWAPIERRGVSRPDAIARPQTKRRIP
jgi:GntR family transcriptional regulator